ncbi:hypothetical protein F7725_016264 [Dissostichus mawsoni]|uniref:Uncharacterized protein n=1 Tax=Dissostichus mawsoni TaxID=36200 RepID=A0A7J5Z342_DISMA|nr:hypothetical protein F7725_016264 [Dissostichus mawsoni]
MEIRIFSRVDLRRSSGGTEAEEQEVSECLALKSSFSCPHNKHQLALRSPGERGQSLMDLRSPGERGQSDGPQDPVLLASQCPSGSPDDL